MADLKPITPEQIQANPILNSMFAPFFSPGAQLGQTQQSTATSGQEQQNLATQQPGEAATSTLDQQKLNAQNYINQAKNQFAQYTNKGLPVPASLYNQVRANMPTAPGYDANTFDSNFKNNIDTDNIWQYNTDQGLAARTLRDKNLTPLINQAQNLMSKYNAIGNKGIGADVTKDLGFLGLGGSQKQYDNQRAALFESINELQKKGNLSAMGISPEDLNQLKASIPDVYSNAEQQQSAASDFQGIMGKLGGGQTTGFKAPQTPIQQAQGAVHTGSQLLNDILGQAKSNPQNVINTTNALEQSVAGVGGFNNVMSLLGGLPAKGASTAEAISDIANIGKNTQGKGYIASNVVKSLLSLGLKGGKGEAAQDIENAAQLAQKSVPWEDFTKTVNGLAKNETQEVKTAINEILGKNTPVGQTGQINPATGQEEFGNLTNSANGSYLLNLRRMMASNLEKTPLGQLKVPASNAQAKAFDIVRQAATSQLKEIAPNIKNPDKLFSIYSRLGKLGGDPGTQLRRLLVAGAAAKGAQMAGVKNNVANGAIETGVPILEALLGA